MFGSRRGFLRSSYPMKTLLWSDLLHVRLSSWALAHILVEFVFTARRSYASEVLGVVILSVRLSVCLSVRLSVCHTHAL